MSARWSALMREALTLAERGRYGASPNPMVGAVLLSRDGNVVGQGAHLRCVFFSRVSETSFLTSSSV